MFRSNFLDVVTSSMNQQAEYLIKYSVAPPPSRDYYGLKVFGNEVIVYLWKISHGPHKAPIVHHSKLSEFTQQKLLQDEICHAFGRYLLKHVRNIAEGNRNTLLTLPKILIEKISSYLEVADIIKLSSLSHIAYEIFNTESIWQSLYNRDNKAEIGINEKEEARIYGWKQLYKAKQMQASVKNQRKLRLQSSIKYSNNTKTSKSSLRATSASKSVAKTTSTMNIATKKLPDISTVDLIISPSFKAVSNTGNKSVHTNDEKPQKRNINVNSAFKVNQKDIKKEDFVAPKIAQKRETKSASKSSKYLTDKYQNKFENPVNKTSNIDTKSQKSKTKLLPSKTLASSKSTIGNVKSSLGLAQSLHKTRPKTKIKTKKVVETKSEILNTDKALPSNPFIVGNSNIELADLIEASLKNIRSPRSIFDCDFSYLQRSDVTKDVSITKNKIPKTNKWHEHKPPRHNVILNYFSDRMTRGDGILEKLSERSEPFSERSNDSLKNKKCLLNKDESYLSLSEKYIKAREELKKSLDPKQKNDSILFEDQISPDLTADFQDRYFNLQKINNINEKIPISRKPLKTSSLLKIRASNSLASRQNDLAEKNSRVISKSQSIKIVNNVKIN